MADNKRLLIIGGAAAGALFLLNKKKGVAKKPTATKNPIANALSKLLPTRGTNSPGFATTNMATRGGTASRPRVPSSGLGFVSTGARGVAGVPATTAGSIADAGVRSLDSILSFLKGRQTTGGGGSSTSPKTSAGGGGSPSAGGGSSSREGGAGRNGGANATGLGGAAGVPQYYDNGYIDENGDWHEYNGYYDDNGNFVPTDEAGNPLDVSVGDVPGASSGYFDPATGVFIDTTGTDADQFVGPQLPYGAIDENGNWDPNAETGLDHDPSTDFTGPIQQGDDFTGPIDNNDDTDAMLLDNSSLDGLDDGTSASSGLNPDDLFVDQSGTDRLSELAGEGDDPDQELGGGGSEGPYGTNPWDE